MRILMIHNYPQFRGGADESTEQEIELLKQHGHEVFFYFRHNDTIKDFNVLRKGLLFLEPTWSAKSYYEVKKIIQDFHPDIAHIQIFFPLVSPSVHYACAESHVPVVQSLRDYRLLCPIAFFFRDGQVCEECITHSPWRGTYHRCYRDSHLQTAAISTMLTVHRQLKTWEEKVDLFVTLTNFSRNKFIEGGLQADKIVVRPNFLATDPGVGYPVRDYALFVGRLSVEKGLETLLEAWHNLPHIPLKIIGDGPLRSWVEDYIHSYNLQNVELVGFVPLSEVLDYLKKAYFLVMPSVWYETFGRTILEAYATGTPVIASHLGAMADLVEHEKTGLLFDPGNAEELTKAVKAALSNPQNLAKWGERARDVFEQKFLAEAAYERLMAIYHQVIALKS